MGAAQDQTLKEDHWHREPIASGGPGEPADGRNSPTSTVGAYNNTSTSHSSTKPSAALHSLQNITDEELLDNHQKVAGATRNLGTTTSEGGSGQDDQGSTVKPGSLKHMGDTVKSDTSKAPVTPQTPAGPPPATPAEEQGLAAAAALLQRGAGLAAQAAGAALGQGAALAQAAALAAQVKAQQAYDDIKSLFAQILPLIRNKAEELLEAHSMEDSEVALDRVTETLYSMTMENLSDYHDDMFTENKLTETGTLLIQEIHEGIKEVVKRVQKQRATLLRATASFALAPSKTTNSMQAFSPRSPSGSGPLLGGGGGGGGNGGGGDDGGGPSGDAFSPHGWAGGGSGRSHSPTSATSTKKQIPNLATIAAVFEDMTRSGVIYEDLPSANTLLQAAMKASTKARTEYRLWAAALELVSPNGDSFLGDIAAQKAIAFVAGIPVDSRATRSSTTPEEDWTQHLQNVVDTNTPPLIIEASKLTAAKAALQTLADTVVSAHTSAGGDYSQWAALMLATRALVAAYISLLDQYPGYTDIAGLLADALGGPGSPDTRCNKLQPLAALESKMRAAGVIPDCVPSVVVGQHARAWEGKTDPTKPFAGVNTRTQPLACAPAPHSSQRAAIDLILMVFLLTGVLYKGTLLTTSPTLATVLQAGLSADKLKLPLQPMSTSSLLTWISKILEVYNTTRAWLPTVDEKEFLNQALYPLSTVCPAKNSPWPKATTPSLTEPLFSAALVTSIKSLADLGEGDKPEFKTLTDLLNWLRAQAYKAQHTQQAMMAAFPMRSRSGHRLPSA
jgi:hypothetical protein